MYSIEALSIFINLDRATHCFHHGANIVGHIRYAIAALVVPIAEEAHSSAIVYKYLPKIGTRQTKALNEVAQMRL